MSSAGLYSLPPSQDCGALSFVSVATRWAPGYTIRLSGHAFIWAPRVIGPVPEHHQRRSHEAGNHQNNGQCDDYPPGRDFLTQSPAIMECRSAGGDAAEVRDGDDPG